MGGKDGGGVDDVDGADVGVCVEAAVRERSDGGPGKVSRTLSLVSLSISFSE